MAGIGFASLFIAQPSVAQLNSVDRGTNQNSDQFAAPNSGDLNLFDMIHRANLGTLIWNPNQQKQQIDSAASDFRARQRKAFEERQRRRSNKNLPASVPEEVPQP